MITKIPRKRHSPRALLDYLQGEGDPHRRLLDTSFVSLTAKGIATELIEFTRSRRPRLTDFTKHIILALAPGEEQSLDRYRELALTYLEAMGYGNAPYAIYLHTDTPHPHLHIVTTPTTWTGKIINEWNDWPRSEAVARKLEKQFNLKRLESSLSARRRAKKQEEVHARVRIGEESHREVFQREIAEAAVQAHTLPEFVAGVVARGYEIRIALNRHHELRGLSFGRDGQHFRGTQLGRAYTGGQLLASFGLDHHPLRHRAALSDLAQAHPRSLILMSVADRSASSEATSSPSQEPQPRNPERVEAEKPTAPPRIPEGNYQVATLDPTKIKPHPDRIPRDAITSERAGWNRQTVEDARNWFARQDYRTMVIFRPLPTEQSQIGFRDVSAAQLAEMKADGFEPAWVVQVGDKHDVILRTPEVLAPDETEALWEEVAARYDLRLPLGVYCDAVRMPGCAVVLPEGREIARLLEASDRPFSAAEETVKVLRETPEREAIRQEAEHLHGVVSGEPDPAAALAAKSAEPVRLPEDSPLAPLQARVEEARALTSPHPVLPQGNEELLAIGQEAHRQIRDLAEFLRGSGVPWNGPEWHQVEQHSAVKDLLSVEAELSRRRLALEDHLGRLEEPLRAQVASLESQARDIAVQPDLAAIHQYQHAAQRFGESQAELATAEQAYSRVLSYQATLDRERMAVAVVAEPRADQVAGTYKEALTREVQLSRGAGESLVPEARGSDQSLHLRLAALEREVAALRHEIAGRGAAVLPAWEAKMREELGTRDALDRALARQSTEPRDLEGALRRNEPKRMMQALWDHQGALAERAVQERGWTVERFDPAERLKQAATRVGDGDLSPDALRRLNAEVVRSVPGSAVPPPTVQAPSKPRELIERYLRVREDIVHLARQAAAPEGLDRAGRSVLLSRSSEALVLHQHVEALHRRALGVLPPERAPRGISQAAYDLAWLKRAAEHGLLPAQAQSHLGNVLRAPMAAGSLATGRVLWLGALALRSMASKLQNYAHRVLTQG